MNPGTTTTATIQTPGNGLQPWMQLYST